MATTLEKALSIISREVDKLDQLSKFSQNEDGDSAFTLDKDSSKMLVDYVKTLVSVNQEWREQAKSDELGKRSDEDLNKLASEALAYLNAEKKKPDDGWLETKTAKKGDKKNGKAKTSGKIKKSAGK